MSKNRFYLPLLAALALAMPSIGVTGAQEHDDHDDHEEHADHVMISPDIAAASGIGVRPADAGTIERQLRVFGELMVAPAGRAEVRARFPGLVTAVVVDIGDRVERGRTLATIESNQSLLDYSVTAPISGIVRHRHVNPGEVTGQKTLFEIVDTRELWAELKIFPGRRGEAAVGQAVRVEGGDRAAAARIEHLLPAGSGEPFALVRARLDNADGLWLPGDRVAGRIVVERAEVGLVVDNRALQQMDGHAVVFVREGERFEPRRVELGRRDDRHSEVLSGLSVGERYVVENSYLIKADLEKSGAGHQH